MTKRLLPWLLVAPLLGGCYYYGESVDYWGELDAVLTAREPERDFSEMTTYAMPESVFNLNNLVEEPYPLTGEFDQEYIDRVAYNLAEYGWTRVDDIDDADVLILNGKVASDYWVTYTYWYPYYPFYIYYPYYPYDSVTVNYPVGTLITVMLKPDEMTDIDDIETVPAVWLATALGVLSDTTDAGGRIVKLVDQAFNQSDYLIVGDAVNPIYDLDVDITP